MVLEDKDVLGPAIIGCDGVDHVIPVSGSSARACLCFDRPVTSEMNDISSFIVIVESDFHGKIVVQVPRRNELTIFVAVASKVHAIDVDISKGVIKEIKNLHGFITANQVK